MPPWTNPIVRLTRYVSTSVTARIPYSPAEAIPRTSAGPNRFDRNVKPSRR